jgi:hypothetical protein
MKSLVRNLAIAAAIGAAIVAALPAHAQWYSSYPPGSAPAHLYSAPRPYAIEVAPNTYVIQRPALPRRSPHVRRVAPVERKQVERKPVEREAVAEKPRRRADPALIEELRKRHGIKGKVKHEVINTTKIVREKPIVIERRRIVTHPRVIDRVTVIEDPPSSGARRRGLLVKETGSVAPERFDGKNERVIEADAEVTILGPDRMTIRLFRKGSNARAN